MQDITHNSYWEEVKDIATECLERAIDEENDDIFSLTHETIDGHQWVIYTFHHSQVERFSDNWEYGLDEGLVEWTAGESSFSELTMGLTFWALNQDVSERLQDVKEEKLEELNEQVEKLERQWLHDKESQVEELNEKIELLERI